MKLISELHDFRYVPENEKLVLERSILGLGRVMNRDVARVLEQIKKKKKKKEIKIRRRKIFCMLSILILPY